MISRFFKFIIVLFLLLNLFVMGLFFYPVPKALESLKPADTVKIYDRNDELLFEVLNKTTGRQSFIPIEKIPNHLKNAFLSIEDRRFYEHSGVDFAAILRAIWQNVAAGEIVSGGSTITQQVVRNVIGVNQKRTISQKAKESILALKITRFFDKEDIFEIYLNSIYFGGLAYGVEAASWQYFDKSVVNLDLAESAFLAGLPQAPNRYYPFKHFEAAKKRQFDVLLAIRQNSKISDAEFNQALEENLTIQSKLISKEAPHFVDFVLSSVSVGGAVGDADLRPLQRQIRTTLDLGLQKRIENIVQSDLTFLSKFNIENAAVIVLDVKKGDILAMMGSRDYENEAIQGAVNVTTSLRQPGSSIKPLLYAAAIEKGWNSDTIIVDEPVRFDTVEGLPYSPKNFDLIYRGEVTLAEALAQSLNVPAVKTLDYVGVGSFLPLAQAFGISTFNQSPSFYGLSLALGSGEVRLLELTSAYSVFANNGNRVSYRFLTSDHPIATTSVIHPTTAQTISAILSSNELRLPAFGEENPLNFSFPVAAKTGTTRNFRDNWTIGYTDDYVVGIWVGNARGEVMEGVSGISGAGPIFYKIMNMLHEMTGTVLTVNPGVEVRVAGGPVGVRHGPTLQDPTEFRIISPFANDVFLFDTTKPPHFQKIKLEASKRAKWYVDNQFVGEGEEVLWPLDVGQHEIKAAHEKEERVVQIQVR